MIRKARNNDVISIQRLINIFAKERLILPRSLIQIYENLRDFWLVEINGEIVGCCALHISWENLAEIKSLAVKNGYQKQGWGRSLAEQALKEAEELEVEKVFVLTPMPDFFSRLGFKVIDKEELPSKIWQECVNCANYMDCNEIPMLYNNKAN